MPSVDLQNPYLEPGYQLRFSRYQQPFIESNSHTTLFAGGWRSGKTTAALGFIAVSAITDAPECTGIVVMPTDKMVGEFLASFFRPAFAHLIAGEERGAGVVHLMNGSRIVFLSGYQPKRIEMYTSAWAYADEIGIMEDGRQVLTKLSGRCSDGRAKRRRIGLTGVPYYGWMAKEFDGRADSKRLMLSVRTSDNKHLPPEYLDEVKENIPANLVDAYLNGKFVPPGGSVYPEFDERIHCIDWVTKRDLPVGCSIDWSPRTPHVLILQPIPAGTTLSNGLVTDRPGVVIIDELIKGDLTTEHLCNLVLAMGYKLSWAVCDPAGNAMQSTSGLTDMQIAKRVLGVPFKFTTDPKLRDIKVGVEHVKTMLKPFKGVPSLFFARSLKRNTSPRAMFNAICTYNYPKDKSEKPISDVPVKDGIVDHAMDCLRYYVINYHPIIRLQARVRSVA